MSKNDGGPAFPRAGAYNTFAEGMSLRDWFAGQALAGVNWPGLTRDGIRLSYAETAESVYALADAMLAAREAQAENEGKG